VDKRIYLLQAEKIKINKFNYGVLQPNAMPVGECLQVEFFYIFYGIFHTGFLLKQVLNINILHLFLYGLKLVSYVIHTTPVDITLEQGKPFSFF